MKISTYAISSIACVVATTTAFHTLPTTNNNNAACYKSFSTTKLYSTKERTPTVSKLSQQMREMQSQIVSDNEDAELIMQALRGRNINDDDSQVQGLEMRLIDFDDNISTTAGDAVQGEDRLPYEYDPVALKKFFSKRPNLVAARVAQVMATGGNVILKFMADVLSGNLKKDPDLEVKRAAELRDTITSLGPFFIKLGQVRYLLFLVVLIGV